MLAAAAATPATVATQALVPDPPSTDLQASVQALPLASTSPQMLDPGQVVTETSTRSLDTDTKKDLERLRVEGRSD